MTYPWKYLENGAHVFLNALLNISQVGGVDGVFDGSGGSGGNGGGSVAVVLAQRSGISVCCLSTPVTHSLRCLGTYSALCFG